MIPLARGRRGSTATPSPSFLDSDGACHVLETVGDSRPRPADLHAVGMQPSQHSHWLAMDLLGTRLLAVVGFSALCGLLFLGFGLVLTSRTEGPEMLKAGVLFLLVAGLLLQVLPHTENGIQFVPLPPWYYASWIASSVSTGCWLCMAGCLPGLIGNKDDAHVAGFLIPAAFGLNVVLSFCSPLGVTTDERPPLAKLIAQWDTRKEERSQAMATLLSDKETLVTRIRKLVLKTKPNSWHSLRVHARGRT